MAYNTFTILDQENDITSIRGTEVTTGMWSGDTGSLSAIYTSSAQVANSGEFYYDLYNGSNITTSDIQFSVAYGHVSGGGSPTLVNLNTSTLPTQVTYAQYRYNIRSGSIDGGLYTTDTTVYGTVFPDYGVIILNPSAISSSVGFSGSNSTTLDADTLLTVPFAPYTGSAATDYQYQHVALVRSISGSMAAGKAFIARSAESITSTNYFIRLKNKDYNYSNNPTYYYSKEY